jgi:hypothetical protein
MSYSQIILQTRKALEPRPANGAYGETLEDMRLTALALIELLARERAGTFEGIGLGFWYEVDRVLEKAQRLVQLAEYRVPMTKDGSFRG